MQSWTLHAGSANLSRALFTEMLKNGTISHPHAEVLDTVERYYTHRMMACSSVQMAEEIYRAAQSMPGASTTKYFLAQHGLQVHVFPTCRWPRLWLMFAVTKGRLILYGIQQHVATHTL